MDNKMIINSAVYSVGIDGTNCAINAIIDGIQMSVPLDPANRHYAEIVRQVELGLLTIQDATV